MIAGSLPSAELGSFLGTVPGMIYRTRLVPPYDSEFISAELGSVVGYPAGDFIGPDPKRRWPDLIHPEDRERVSAAVLAAPADGSIIEVEYRVRRAEGSHAWILGRARNRAPPSHDRLAWRCCNRGKAAPPRSLSRFRYSDRPGRAPCAAPCAVVCGLSSGACAVEFGSGPPMLRADHRS
jgi:hypothetical protein